jgi:hypothetical protein
VRCAAPYDGPFVHVATNTFITELAFSGLKCMYSICTRVAGHARVVMTCGLASWLVVSTNNNQPYHLAAILCSACNTASSCMVVCTARLA